MRIISNVEINTLDIKNISKQFIHNKRKMWTIVPAGMGNVFYAKHDGTRNYQPIYVYFQDSESWGQYDQQDVVGLVHFIPDDYCCPESCEASEKYINSLRSSIVDQSFIKCPVCRTTNTMVQHNYFYPKTKEKCVVCLVNNVSTVLNKCNHSVLCNECVQKL